VIIFKLIVHTMHSLSTPALLLACTPVFGQSPLLPRNALPAMGTYPIKAWFAPRAEVPNDTIATGQIWDYSGYEFILDTATADAVMPVEGSIAAEYFEDAGFVLYTYAFQESEYLAWHGDTLVTFGRYSHGREEVEPIDPPMVWMWPNMVPGQRMKWHSNGLSDFPHQAREMVGRGKLITPQLVVEDAVLLIHYHEAPDSGRQFIFYRATDLLRPVAHVIPGKGMLVLE